jgi:hypothetical protein
LLPSSGWMNPKPFWPLNHFTVPCVIARLSVTYVARPRASAAGFSRFREVISLSCGYAQAKSFSRSSIGGSWGIATRAQVNHPVIEPGISVRVCSRLNIGGNRIAALFCRGRGPSDETGAAAL